MAIKKSKEEWANEPAKSVNVIAPVQTEEQNPVKIKLKRKETKIGFAVRIPESLYSGIKDYLEKYGRTSESINEILITGGETELRKRLDRIDKVSDKKSRKQELIAELISIANELEEL